MFFIVKFMYYRFKVFDGHLSQLYEYLWIYEMSRDLVSKTISLYK